MCQQLRDEIVSECHVLLPKFGPRYHLEHLGRHFPEILHVAGSQAKQHILQCTEDGLQWQELVCFIGDLTPQPK
jgi:hypothetical protein